MLYYYIMLGTDVIVRSGSVSLISSEVSVFLGGFFKEKDSNPMLMKHIEFLF